MFFDLILKSIRSIMVDRISSETRSKLMRCIKSKDTKPEMAVRRIVHGLGYRYRLHDRRLPGCPDLVFKTRRKVIFVHGCFWHMHNGCKVGHLPKSQQAYWEPKLKQNKVRDKQHLEVLTKAGWECLVIWECEIMMDSSSLIDRIISFLTE